MTDLVARAREAMKNAYAPYSEFRVGAAIEAADGRVFTGCNVESASYGVTICAERMALGAAVTAGARAFRRIAVATEVDPPAAPCGACRQLLAEFGLDLEVVAAGPASERRWTLRALLPDAFTRASLALAPLALAFVLGVAACTEKIVAPGACPEFCPTDSIEVADTIFTDVIEQDSAFAGYFQAHESEQLAVADLPGVVDSRALFILNGTFTRVVQDTSDTVTVPITVDSSLLQLNVLRRDTSASDLWIKLYRMPLALDSTTTFAAVNPDFQAAPVDSVNVDSMLALPFISDTATVRIWGDSIRQDTAGHVLRVSSTDSSLILFFFLDTLQAPFAEADSGKLAFGVRVAADSLASIALGANHLLIDRDAGIRRYYHYTGKTLAGADTTKFGIVDRQSVFDTFVFDPPTAGLDAAAVDTVLAVGGAPAARSLLRVRIPPLLRDSTDVVRATLILVPIAPVPGAVGDSFTVVARPVLADLGAKSPLITNSAVWGATTVRLNSADTVRIEITNMIRGWAQDTSAATAFALGQVPEASSYTQIRFYSSRVPAFRPALRVTYVRRFPFGRP